MHLNNADQGIYLRMQSQWAGIVNYVTTHYKKKSKLHKIYLR